MRILMNVLSCFQTSTKNEHKLVSYIMIEHNKRNYEVIVSIFSGMHMQVKTISSSHLLQIVHIKTLAYISHTKTFVTKNTIYLY